MAEAARMAEVERERAETERLADQRAREAAALQEQENERLRREDEARRVREAEEARLRSEEAERLARAEADQQRLAAEARQREDEARRLAREAAARHARDEESRLALEAELQRRHDEAARLELEEQLREARAEAERLRLELERERARAAQKTALPADAPTATQPAPVQPVAPAVALPKSEALFVLDSNERLKNGPGKPTKFELDEPRVITLIRTTHWNGGRGAPPGQIGLQCRDGKSYGPWPASGLPDRKGVPNAHWVVKPDIALNATVCSIQDSDPATWSYAEDTRQRGLARVEGYTPAGGTDEDSGMTDKLRGVLDLFKMKR